MKLAENLWLEGPFYVDIDLHQELRIIGPGNHLFFGSVGTPLQVQDLKLSRGELTITARIPSQSFFLHDPAIGHIRKMRRYTEGRNGMTFAQVVKKYPGELAPNYIGTMITDTQHELIFRRLFQNHWYGVKLAFPHSVKLERLEKRRGYNVSTDDKYVEVTIITDTDELPESGIKEFFAKREAPKLTPGLQKLWERTAHEIEHLVANNKTSGVEYGTVFPRDWMESADLGDGDLAPATIAYMYHKAMELTDDHGQGWHENSIGEMAAEEHQELDALDQNLDELLSASNRLSRSIKTMIDTLRRMYVNRSMIDIEPHYILGLRRIDTKNISKVDADHLRRAAKYLLSQAEQNDLITFKRSPSFFKRHRDQEEYAHAGNWRDSDEAFKMIHPVIAPYDVNVVFYPQALRTMLEHSKWLGIDPSHIKPMIAKWDTVRDWYRFSNADGTPGYALALYDVQGLAPGIKYRKLEVNHIDESYDLFYGQPSEADIISFCERLISPNYFFTPSGPQLVGAGDGYTTTNYHGRVIWAKQAAFVVAGLQRQLQEFGATWQPATRQLVKNALGSTAAACLNAFEALAAIPELHYDDHGKPKFYTSQPKAEGPMNLVQLWSAVGGRRIMGVVNEASNGRPNISTS